MGRRKKTKKVQEPSDSEEEYEIEKILDKRIRGGCVEYFLKWKGFSSLENSWEPENHLNCQDLIDDFNARHSAEQISQSGSETEEPEAKRGKTDTVDSASEEKEDKKTTVDEDKNDKTEKRKEPGDEEDDKKKKKSKSVTRGSSGFDRGWEVEEILGATHSYGKLHFLISWKGKDHAELVPAQIAHKKSPQAVINYYEARLQWCDRDEKGDKVNTEEASVKIDM